MSARRWQFVHGVIFLVGIVLMAGGIVTKKYSAGIVGLIVAAVNFGYWQRWRRQQ